MAELVSLLLEVFGACDKQGLSMDMAQVSEI